MSRTASDLGLRLKQARESAALTQAAVAERLALPRSAVAEMEAGSRRVTVAEAVHLARIYGRAPWELLGAGPMGTDPVAVLLAEPEVAGDAGLQQRLRDLWVVCTECADLARRLGIRQEPGQGMEYHLPAPGSSWEAVQQGRTLAESERGRMQLGLAPLGALAQWLVARGVDVAETELPEGVDGAVLQAEGAGTLLVVPRGLAAVHQRFVLARLFGEARLDRARGARLCRGAADEGWAAARTRAFAAHLLMPEAAVRAWLGGRGKGGSSRRTVAVPSAVCERDDAVRYAVRKDAEAARELRAHDVASLAGHFGVSHGAALTHLLHLELVTREGFARLQCDEEEARAIAVACGAAPCTDTAAFALRERVLALGIEAHAEGLVSRARVAEIGRALGLDVDAVTAALDACGLLAPFSGVTKEVGDGRRRG